MSENKIGIVIGRFQPLHKGHKVLIDKALSECETVVVFIGSSNKLPDFNNPFSNEERKEFILRSYTGETKLNIVLLHDKPYLSDWVGNVYGYLGHMLGPAGDLDPSTVTLYTASKDKEFYEESFLFNVVALEISGISGTEIRRGLYDETLEGQPMPRATAALVASLSQTKHWGNMKAEFVSCLAGKARAVMSHAFNNPIEPVVHAVVVQDNLVLLVKRNSVRGHGQWALPGGFLESNETTQAGALRELKEETGVDLSTIQCAQLATALEENLDDIGVRTLGINFLFAVKTGETIEVTIDPKEVLEYKWIPITDVTSERELLFYNHNLVVQRLISSIADSPETPEETETPEENNEPIT